MKPHVRITIETLLRNSATQREIERRTGVDRKTIRKYLGLSNSPGVATGISPGSGEIPPPRPPDGGAASSKVPAAAASACEPHREWITAQVGLGRNAVSIYQDLVESRGFTHKYNSVKRFCRDLRAREPERFDVLEFLPGEEAQVDYGQGAPTLTAGGKYKRPYLFVMTLKYSGKSFRKVVWKTSAAVWARLHEEAFRSFGGCPQYVVLDNLKEGVIRPDIYAPELNSVYSAMLAHYGVVADPCRVRDPDRKGTVESAIQHTQSTALKGRKFESIEEQSEWLRHWEERWASPRIHGRKKRQVMEMFLEEKPCLAPLPVTGFRYFEEGVRTVDDAGLVQVSGSYYAALPAALYSKVRVRIFENEVEILDEAGQVLRRHRKAEKKGAFLLEEKDRLFNPSRETERMIVRVGRIGPKAQEFAAALFARHGRPGQKAIYGLMSLARNYKRVDIERAATRLLEGGTVSYAALKRILERGAAVAAAPESAQLTQSGAEIRPLNAYQDFWEMNSQSNQEEKEDEHVYH